MKDVYPEYADRVDLYAVGQSPFEDIDLMEEYRIEQGYPWPVAKIDPNVLKSLNVFVQSTKIALNGDGVITYRAGYGDGGVEVWREVFENLVDPANR
ncbi:MAG: hypothetical protein O3A93_09535 [Chloroflexi bacterium]|nr:hypothetical protein [Chloroflexota bacterium]MDA1271486.1 hypothetical protein [Chloroflexota bacterium]PKB58607.1 MAG: hypothetical protein BZY83_06005 [SAR202 cluster bacterium Casp-Chloro-G2]